MPIKPRLKSRRTVSLIESLEQRTLFAAPSLASLSVVRAGSGISIQTLSNNATLDLASLGPINVRANAGSTKPASVVFKLDGKTIQTESNAPFDAGGDVGNTPAPNAWNISTGAHTLSATPYSLSAGKGTAGAPLTVAFTVNATTPPLPPPVTPPPTSSGLQSLTIVQAGSGITIATLNNNDTLDLSALGQISVRAVPGADHVGSVVFKLDGKTVQTESNAPFDLAGDVGNSPTPNPWNVAVGSHTLSATPYSQSSGQGTAGAALTVLFTVQSSAPAPYPTRITWATGASSPVVRAEAVGTAVNGKLYVFGGFDNEGSPDTSIPLQSRCDVYDPATNTWTRLADFPEPFSHSGPAIVGTDLWFVGGYVGDHPGPGTTHVWIYHTTTDTWERGPDLPVARGAASAALVGNTIYITGGMDVTRTLEMPTTYALDLDNQSAGWIQKADNPLGRNHVAAASLNGYYYEIGGQLGQENAEIAQNEVDRYDPASDTWTTVASLPQNLGHVTGDAIVYKGHIILVGGDIAHDQPQRCVYSYDPATDKWTLLAQLPVPRSTPVVGIINNQLIVTTGNGPDATSNTYIGTLS